MAYFIDNDGNKHIVSNFKNMDQRCVCGEDYYTYIKNPIRIGLRPMKNPTVFKSTDHSPYDEEVQQGRAITFCGCICELDRISKNYRIHGALYPTQYNWGFLQVDKKTGKRRGAPTDYKRVESWT